MQRRRGSGTVGLTALLLLAACSTPDPRLSRPRPVFSPNGELLSSGGRHAPHCPEALGRWWDRLAQANGGRLSREVFMADAEAQFTAMDLDHDGFITPSELSEVRAGLEDAESEKIPPPGPDGRTPSASGSGSGGAPPGGGSRSGGRRGGAGAGGAMPQRPASSGQIPPDVVDPVMSADKSLSFKVSHALSASRTMRARQLRRLIRHPRAGGDHRCPAATAPILASARMTVLAPDDTV